MSRINSLVSNYESDDDIDDSPDEKSVSFGSSRNYRRPSNPRQDDTNYDEVQMSLSEDSDDSNYKSSRDGPSRDRDRNDRSSPKDRDKHRNEERSRHKERDSRNDSDNSKSKNGDRVRSERHREDKDDDRSGREKRDEQRQRSRSKERSSSSRDDRHNRDRRERNDRRRSRSPRDRRRSRSPRRRSRSRSRSRSRDRGGRGSYYKRYDRGNNRYDSRSEKSDTQSEAQQKDNSQPKDRFYMPGITGKFREQIEKRKLLWQKNKEPEQQATVAGPSKVPKVWETTTFAQDNDGKVANKFKRLMGIRNAGEGSSSGTEVLKKQEEMFTSMEAQYEVARTATHTMRGVGLGFGSYQR